MKKVYRKAGILPPDNKAFLTYFLPQTVYLTLPKIFQRANHPPFWRRQVGNCID
jgi:hypothetical protein